MYRSRTHIQITQPEWEEPYTEGSTDRKRQASSLRAPDLTRLQDRLITLYQQLHETVHARSGQSAPLRLVYIKTEHEAVLAWVSALRNRLVECAHVAQVTKPFELYLAVNPQMTKAGVVSVANSIALWVSSEEARLFLKDAPVF